MRLGLLALERRKQRIIDVFVRARHARLAVVVPSVAVATMAGAVVMASAARRGGVVYTSDAGDLERLRSFFPTVRVLGV